MKGLTPILISEFNKNFLRWIIVVLATIKKGVNIVYQVIYELS